MEATTKTEILAILKRDEITSPTDEISDRFPGEYANDQEYVDCRLSLCKIINLTGAKAPQPKETEMIRINLYNPLPEIIHAVVSHKRFFRLHTFRILGIKIEWLRGK